MIIPELKNWQEAVIFIALIIIISVTMLALVYTYAKHEGMLPVDSKRQQFKWMAV